MISRAARIRMQVHGIELWIEHEEILREQAAVSDEATALAGDAGAAIQKIRKLAHTAVCDKRPRIGVRAQRRGARDRCSIDHARTQIESAQHSIEENGIASGACRIKGIKKPVLENVDRVQWNRAP